jgi:predicted GNAT family acetyltransferase
MSDPVEVTDNSAASRYEATVEGTLAILEYQRSISRVTLTHTEVPTALEGRGVGSALARFALDDARTRGLEVVPTCPFVAAYIRRHPEYLEIVHPDHRAKLAAEG